MNDNDSVILEKRGAAYWITLNRPDKRNALNAAVIAGIGKGYRAAHEDADVRCRRTPPSPRLRASAGSAWPAAWDCCA